MNSLNQKEYLRYNRHIMVPQVGESGQQRFKDAHVLIIGMGGLGCPAAQYLAAAGVGEISLLDHDVIEVSNLQRQILYTEADIGQFKVDVARTRLLAQNPHIKAHAYACGTEDIELATLFEYVDLVLDCTDNAATRKQINAACVVAGIKLVSAAAIQGQGQMVSFDFSQPGSPCYQCLFPDTQEQTLNCQTAGVFSPVLGVLGSLQASEALRLLLGRSEHLSKLTLFDVWGMAFRQFNVNKSEVCEICN